MPVNARRRIPARVGLQRVVHLDRHQIFAVGIQVTRQVVGEADISEWPFPQVLAVDPHLADLVHTIEFNRDVPPLVGRRNLKAFSIPVDTGGSVAARSSARLGLDKGPFDAPIVRQVEATPGCIVENRLRSARRIAFVKLSSEVERIPYANRRLGNLRCQMVGGIERQSQRSSAHRPAEQPTARYRIV